MRVIRLLSTFFVVFFFLSALAIPFTPFEEKQAVEITADKADFYIQSVEQKHFGTGLLVLDMNNDGIKDFAVIQGIHQRNVFWAKNRLFIFDGCTVLKETPTNSIDAKILLKPLTAKWKILRPEGVSEAGFDKGDFNGDGCDDILFALAPPIGDYIFFLILGSKDFFEKHGKQRLKKDYHKFAQTRIFSSAVRDFDKYDENARVAYAFSDINGDKKEDIIITSTAADFEEAARPKINDTGKLFIILGKEEPPKSIDLKKDSDITIVGDTKKARLGSGFYSIKNFDVDKGGFKSTDIFVKQSGKIFYLPNIEKLSGEYTISKIPDANSIDCEGIVHSWQDINNDLRRDLIIETPFSNEFVFEMQSNDNLRYQAYKKDGLYPLLSVVYGKYEGFETGQHIDNLADIVLYFKPKIDTEEMYLIGIEDFDRNGELDAVFFEEKKHQIIQHLAYDFLTKREKYVLDEMINFSAKIFESGFSPLVVPANFNGNETTDFIAIEPVAEVESASAPGMLLKKCGKIYIYFDKPLTQGSLENLKETADVIICGQQQEEQFGFHFRVEDVDSDGLDDLIVLSPWKDLISRGDKKNDAGAVYIFSGKSLWNHVQAESSE
jgi:hypothetical protein